MCKKKTKRMANPDDTLVKRQIVNTGDVIHKFHNLPGEFVRALANEYPNAKGGTPRVDGAYLMKYRGELLTGNLEDESIRVDKSTLEKMDGYRRNLEYFHQRGVFSMIRTSLARKDCLEFYDSSPTLRLRPWIISLPEYDGAKRLSNITTKIKNKVTLSEVEAMNIVMIPKMFTENQDKILEKVSVLF